MAKKAKKAKKKVVSDDRVRKLCEDGFNNVEIAERLKCSRECIRQKRQLMGFLPSPQGIRRKKLQASTIIGRLNKIKTANKTPTQIAEILKCDRSYIRFLLTDMELPFKLEKRRSGKAKYHWDILEPKDWERLSDLMIQELLGVKTVSIVTQRRSPDRGDMPKADRNFVDSPKGYAYFKKTKARISPILIERKGQIIDGHHTADAIKEMAKISSKKTKHSTLSDKMYTGTSKSLSRSRKEARSSKEARKAKEDKVLA